MPPPTLETPRVRLRALNVNDLAFCLTFANDPDLRTRLRFHRPLTESDERAWMRHACGPETHSWVMETPEGQPVGLISLDNWDPIAGHAELGLGILDPAARGQGMGYDACRLVLRHAFTTLRLRRVYLEVLEGNPARHLYARLGLSLEGTLRKHAFKQGRFLDKHVMGILREEWHE